MGPSDPVEVSVDLALPLREQSQVADGRRKVVGLATHLGFNETEAGRVAIVATELATNLLKHGVDGELLFRPLYSEEGVEILAVDSGRGISNLATCIEDGYSTSGSAGTGLGSIRRLSDVFDVYSQPDKGTVILSRLYRHDAARRPAPFSVGVVCVPKSGEEDCGDAWAARIGATNLGILVADGLGHGTGAAEAARQAVRVFRQHPNGTPAELIELSHEALRPTRGAAALVVAINPNEGTARFAGIGNIAGTILSYPNIHRLLSHNGIVGHQLNRVQEITCAWEPNSVLIVHSDGLPSNWDLAAYPGLIGRDPSLIAGVLYRDFSRRRDDVTVLVACHQGDDAA